jgi:aldehyde:ferredoxin oxidoreductase
MQPILGDFGQFSGSAHDWWTRRQALAYIFGIHPIFAIICPEISEELLLEMSAKGAGLELSQETLDRAIHEIRN